MSKEIKVESLPHCDICGDIAEYDGKTEFGPWGYMCESCFAKHGVGLGLGVGQKMVLEEEECSE